jgi:hypothetical protein
MQSDLLTTVLLHLALALATVMLGLCLVPEDFWRIGRDAWTSSHNPFPLRSTGCGWMSRA